MTDKKTDNNVSIQYLALQKACEEKGFKLASHQGKFWVIDGFNKFYNKGTFEQVSSWLEDVESPFDVEPLPITDLHETFNEPKNPLFMNLTIVVAFALFAIATFTNQTWLGFIGIPPLVFAWYKFCKINFSNK